MENEGILESEDIYFAHSSSFKTLFQGLELGLGWTYLHPGVNVHQSSSGNRLHDAIIVSENLLQLSIAMSIGGAEHQRAHDVGDGAGHRGRRVKATPPTRQQLSAQTVHLRQN